MGLGAASTAAQYVVTHPQTSHNPINLDFLLDPLSKSEFLSFSTYETDIESLIEEGILEDNLLISYYHNMPIRLTQVLET